MARSTSLAASISVTPDNSLTALPAASVAFHTRLKRDIFAFCDVHDQIARVRVVKNSARQL
jgi:hypothetical protein